MKIIKGIESYTKKYVLSPCVSLINEIILYILYKDIYKIEVIFKNSIISELTWLV